MKVILRENIENLGKKGDIVKVASGYGRNFLIPKKMALEVTPTNAKMIAIEQAALQKGLEQEMSTYNEMILNLNQVSLSFSRKTSEKDVIFGSVSSTDIRDALEELGFNIEKKKIILDDPIKRLGNYTIPVKVFHEERAEIKIEVVKEGAPSEEARPEEVPEVKEEQETEPAVSEEPEVVVVEEVAPETETEEETKTVAPEEPVIDEVLTEVTEETAPEESEEEAAAPEEPPAEGQEAAPDEKIIEEKDEEKSDQAGEEKREEPIAEEPAEKKEKEDEDKEKK
jgi:large subunit ribosomal protein L9